MCTQLCLTLCDPMGCSPPGPSVPGIFQARILEWVDISFSGDLPNPGIEPLSLVSPALVGGFFTTGATNNKTVSCAPSETRLVGKWIEKQEKVVVTCECLWQHFKENRAYFSSVLVLVNHLYEWISSATMSYCLLYFLCLYSSFMMQWSGRLGRPLVPLTIKGWAAIPLVSYSIFQKNFLNAIQKRCRNRGSIMALEEKCWQAGYSPVIQKEYNFLIEKDGWGRVRSVHKPGRVSCAVLIGVSLLFSPHRFKKYWGF